MKKVIFYPLIFLIVCILVFVIYSISYQEKKIIINKILNNTENELVSLDKYFVYGQHLNISGSLKLDDIENINNIKLVFKSNDNEIEYNLDYEIIDNKISFMTSKEINGGIKLDDIKIDNYFILLRVEFKDNKKYYTIQNNTEYKNIEYYTITKNNTNNKILVEFGKNKSTNKKYMQLKVKRINLDDEIYDIVIDAGHGGIG